MTAWRDHKVRSDETWARVRRGWEAGETGASLAKRYDVGLDNLWRRRATEGWSREQPEDPPATPVEGWDRYAYNKLEAFETELDEVRELALDLVRIMTSEAIDEAPLWHVPFLYAWRAENRGPEVAAADRERARDKPWFKTFWDRDGRLKPLETLDQEMWRLHRDEWRARAGIPDGAAVHYP